MAIIAFIFGIMSCFYRYVTPEELGEKKRNKEEKKPIGGIETPLVYVSADGEETQV